MGNCIIVVHVTGSHHNSIESDIDQMAGKFVDELKQKHHVTSASIVSGGENDLMHTAARFPIKET